MRRMPSLMWHAHGAASASLPLSSWPARLATSGEVFWRLSAPATWHAEGSPSNRGALPAHKPRVIENFSCKVFSSSGFEPAASDARGDITSHIPNARNERNSAVTGAQNPANHGTESLTGREAEISDGRETNEDEITPTWEARDFEEPVFLRSTVVTGFGRGSREMGIPTANLDPSCISSQLPLLPKGVYYGWARIPELNDSTDSSWHGMVVNVGDRPTFADGEGLSVEAHIFHSFKSTPTFYGTSIHCIVTGFIRGERRFSSPGELISRIHEDIRIGKGKVEARVAELETLKSAFENSEH